MLQLVYLGNGEMLRYVPDEHDLLATERKVEAIWQAIRRAEESGDWRPRRSRLCDWCAHQALCPAFGGTPPPLPGAGETTPTADRPDPGRARATDRPPGVTSCGGDLAARRSARRSGRRPGGRGPISRSSGRSVSHRVACRNGQRVWKRQPVGGLAGRRQVALEQDPLAAVLDVRVRDRDRRHQRHRVRVQRLARTGRRAAPARPCRRGTSPPIVSTDVPHHGEVVGDHEVGQPELLLQLLEQVDHLRLDRDVERARPARRR